MVETRATRELAASLGCAPGERLLPVACRIVEALDDTKLLRRLPGERFYAAPDWACFAGRALHDEWGLNERDWDNVVLALRVQADLRAAVVSAWLLVELEDRDPREAVRALLLAELGL